MRYQFREHFLQLMAERSQQANHESPKVKDSQDEVAVTLSLLTGDRSLISDDMTALYQFGGISHLSPVAVKPPTSGGGYKATHTVVRSR